MWSRPPSRAHLYYCAIPHIGESYRSNNRVQILHNMKQKSNYGPASRIYVTDQENHLGKNLARRHPLLTYKLLAT